jgi:hypothetical protein
MTDVLHSAPLTSDDGRYLQIQQFYSRQMRLLDAGAVAEWAQTFTEDGVFDAAGLPEPVAGRATIAASAGQASARLAEAGRQHRHWIGMLTVESGTDGGVTATSYALVIEVPRGGEARLHRSTVCVDELVPAPHGWLVRHRRVTRDDMP